MADLSPATQAILDAYGDFEAADTDAMAAALRAAADQVAPKDADPVWGTDIDWAKWRALDDVRDELLGIAAELEGTRPTSEGS
jgi:hypothetical protein